MHVKLPRGLRAELLAWARDARPAEACGLLIGEQGSRNVLRTTLARNLRADPQRYELDPADHLKAQVAAHAAGLDVIGVWHSHPEGPARPSVTDEREALPDWLYLIVDALTGELSAWRLGAAGRFDELNLQL